eukprot:scaffold34402_cov51-Phaeocystis_antarctica.AAC.1
MPVLPFVCPPDDQYGRSMVVRGLGRALLRLCLSVTAEIAHGDGGGISSGHVGQRLRAYGGLLHWSALVVVYYKPTVRPKAPIKGVRTTWKNNSGAETSRGSCTSALNQAQIDEIDPSDGPCCSGGRYQPTGHMSGVYKPSGGR